MLQFEYRSQVLSPRWQYSKEVWCSSGEFSCFPAQPGFESLPGASLQRGPRDGRLHCKTEKIKYKKNLGLGCCEKKGF